MSGIVLELRDVIAVIAGIGAPLAVYVGMRTTLTRVETQLAAVLDHVRELRAGRDSHGEQIGDTREQLADHAARIGAIERRLSGQYAATAAEQTGPHKRP